MSRAVSSLFYQLWFLKYFSIFRKFLESGTSHPCSLIVLFLLFTFDWFLSFFLFLKFINFLLKSFTFMWVLLPSLLIAVIVIFTLACLFSLQISHLQCFPYDFRCEEIMSLVKHIVARCETNTPLADKMSDILSALLIKLTDLSQHEEEMKAYKKPLDEVASKFSTIYWSFYGISFYFAHQRSSNG